MNQNTELKPYTRQREARIKMAQAILNMDALRREMKNYSLPALQKAAAAGYGQELRIKYAALQLQYTIEKQAFLSSLLRAGLKYGGKAWRGLRGVRKPLSVGAGIGAASSLKGHEVPATPATLPSSARNSPANAPAAPVPAKSQKVLSSQSPARPPGAKALASAGHP